MLLHSADPARAQSLDETVAQLAHPVSSAEECDRLIRAGEVGVERLREVLRWVRRDNHGDDCNHESTAAAAAFALGRLAGIAVPATPELLDIYRFSSSPAARNNAMWALGRVASHATEPVRQHCRLELGRQWTPDLNRLMYEVALRELTLGPTPGAVELQHDLRLGVAGAIAAARAVLDGRARPDERLLMTMATMVRDAFTPTPFPWNVDRRHWPALGELGEVLWRWGDEKGPAAARALLLHDAAELRIVGIDLLGKHAPPDREATLDIARLLRDSDESVRTRALASLNAMGSAAIVAVPLLRVAAAADATADWRAMCEQTCASIVSIRRGKCLEPDTDLVQQAMNEIAAGSARTLTLPGSLSREAEAALQEWLWGLAGLDGVLVVAAEQALARTELRSPATGVAITRLCGSSIDETGWMCGLRMVARHGTATLLGVPDLEVQLLRAAATGSWQWNGVAEAAAWARAGPHTTEAALLLALAGDDARVALRALVEVARRGRIERRGETILQETLTRRWHESVFAVGEDWPGTGTLSAASLRLADHDLAMAAALARKACSLNVPEGTLTASTLAAALAVPLEEAGSWLAVTHPPEQWARLAHRLERKVMTEHSLPVLFP